MQAYLDNSATTRPTDGVIEAVARAMREDFYNPSSLYAPAMIPEKQMNLCRDKIRKALHAVDARVIFTSGGTEANNLALFGSIGAMRPPYRAAVSAVEHPSVLEASQRLEEMGCEVFRIPVNEAGELDYDALASFLQGGASLVSCMQVNNETGAKTDVARLSKLVRALAPDARLHVDGVQGFLREEIDFRLIDMYTLSGHKIHAPKGVGALVVRRNLRLKSTHVGGGQEEMYRSGTENTPGIAGLSEAIDEMRKRTDRHETLMSRKLRLVEKMREVVPGLLINGPKPEDGAAHIVNFSFPGVRGEVMLHALEEAGVYASTGSACSSKKRHVSAVLTAMGIPADRAEWALRFSLCPYTTEEEIDYAAKVAGEKYEILKKFQRR